jgi:hypothetical protein
MVAKHSLTKSKFRVAQHLDCRSAGVRRGLFHLRDAAGNLSEGFLGLFYQK